ncbi:MAG: SGNH/GDSL hydrolase family protein [Pleurocapsa sp. MO_226.B13]|nr:SGNH/GDSL hydrolase family protein [Pleurocapsa sp. MO_226.B13]
MGKKLFNDLKNTMHLVLLGDSIFDNALYVGDEPEVIKQLQAKLPAGWKATLKAIDGDQINDVHAQLEQLPEDATHLILSVGGNNALSHLGILDRRVNSSAQVFSELADISEEFERQYQKLLTKILSFNIPTAICTIYYPNHSEYLERRIAIAALATFNDVIIRQAFGAGIPLIDLRLTCNQPQDYVNAIEPSSLGGEKIVNAIMNLVLEHNFQKPYTQVFY